jgi:hypothetical protein
MMKQVRDDECREAMNESEVMKDEVSRESMNDMIDERKYDR